MATPVIILRALSGPWAGQERTDEDLRRLGITPDELLLDLAKRDIRWEVVCPDPATPDAAAWARADITAKVFRAALHGRPVRALGRVWEFPADPQDPRFGEMVGELEDAIVGSDRMVGVASDDEYGLVLSLPS